MSFCANLSTISKPPRGASERFGCFGPDRARRARKVEGDDREAVRVVEHLHGESLLRPTCGPRRRLQARPRPDGALSRARRDRAGGRTPSAGVVAQRGVRRQERALGVEPDLGAGVVGRAACPDQLDGVHVPADRLDRFAAGVAERPDAGVAARADDHHLDPAAVDERVRAPRRRSPASWIIQLRRSWLPASSGHSTPVPENVMRPSSRRKFAACADRRARWSRKRTGARPWAPMSPSLVCIRTVSPATWATKASAIAVARGRPADLPAAVQGSAAHLIVQGDRWRQLGAVEGRRLVAGGEQGGRAPLPPCRPEATPRGIGGGACRQLAAPRRSARRALGRAEASPASAASAAREGGGWS